MISSVSVLFVNMFVALLSSDRAGYASECRQLVARAVTQPAACVLYIQNRTAAGPRLCSTAGLVRNGEITVAVDR